MNAALVREGFRPSTGLRLTFITPNNEEEEATGSALSSLVAWANVQENWTRAIVSQVLATGVALDHAACNAAAELYLVERSLESGNPNEVALLGQPDGESSGTESLRLMSMSGCHNVNALATGQQIDFHPQLTVLMGENGSGKSGYVRVIKSVASVRSAEAILSNAAAASGNDRSGLLLVTYDCIRAWCESYVETKLLADVTKRFRQNISMDRLVDIRSDRLQSAIDTILPVYHKACGYIQAHARPLQASAIQPTCEEANLDWQSLQSAQRNYEAS